MGHKRWTVFMGAALLMAPMLVAEAQQSGALVDKQRLRVQPEAAEQAFGESVQVTVFGDPSKPGLYAIRRRFKPGEASRPHYHDQDRLVTVIKGTWYTGDGDVYDMNKTTPVRTGGFMLHPAGFHHYDGAKDQEVIVQIIGMGPVQTVATEAGAK
jgi:quercetin dioxygenase-like cupin family protein